MFPKSRRLSRVELFMSSWAVNDSYSAGTSLVQEKPECGAGTEPQHDSSQGFTPHFRHPYNALETTAPVANMTGVKSQLETANCIVPLIPCPLVHPSAMRAPNIITAPPVTDTA